MMALLSRNRSTCMMEKKKSRSTHMFSLGFFLLEVKLKFSLGGAHRKYHLNWMGAVFGFVFGMVKVKYFAHD